MAPRNKEYNRATAIFGGFDAGTHTLPAALLAHRDGIARIKAALGVANEVSFAADPGAVRSRLARMIPDAARKGDLPAGWVEDLRAAQDTQVRAGTEAAVLDEALGLAEHQFVRAVDHLADEIIVGHLRPVLDDILAKVRKVAAVGGVPYDMPRLLAKASKPIRDAFAEAEEQAERYGAIRNAQAIVRALANDVDPEALSLFSEFRNLPVLWPTLRIAGGEQHAAVAPNNPAPGSSGSPAPSRGLDADGRRMPRRIPAVRLGCHHQPPTDRPGPRGRPVRHVTQISRPAVRRSGRQGRGPSKAGPRPAPQGEPMSKTIPIRIRKGQAIEAVIDDDDYERLAAFRWFFPTGKVAPVRIGTVGGRKTSITLARDVMGLPNRRPARCPPDQHRGPRLPPGEPRCVPERPGRSRASHALPRGRDRGGGLTWLQPRWTVPASWSCSLWLLAAPNAQRPARRASRGRHMAVGQQEQEFAEAVEVAAGQGRAVYEDLLRQAAEKDWRAALALYESIYLDNAKGRRVSSIDDLAAPVTAEPLRITDDEAEQRVAKVLTILRDALGSEKAVQQVVEANVRRLRLIQG